MDDLNAISKTLYRTHYGRKANPERLRKEGTVPAMEIRWANVPFAVDRNGKKQMTVCEICDNFHVTAKAVQNSKEPFCLDGVDEPSREKRKTHLEAKITGTWRRGLRQLRVHHLLEEGRNGSCASLLNGSSN